MEENIKLVQKLIFEREHELTISAYKELKDCRNVQKQTKD